MNRRISILFFLVWHLQLFAAAETSITSSIQESYLRLQNESVATQKELAETVNQIKNAEIKVEETSGYVEDKRKKFAKRISSLNSLARQKWGLILFSQNEISLRKSLGTLQLISQKDFEQLASYKIGQKNLALQIEKLSSSKAILQTRLTKLEQDQKKLALLEKNLVAGLKQDGVHSLLSKKGSLISPIKGAIKSQYGSIRDDNGDFTFFQSGLQFLTEPQTQVAAVSDGKIVFADKITNRGETIIIEHEGSYFSVYSRLGKIQVNLDQNVQLGQQIGTTSDSTFYFELRQQSIPIDPKPWLKIDTKGQL